MRYSLGERFAGSLSMFTRVVSALTVLLILSLAPASTAEEKEPIEVAEFPRFSELLDWVNFVRRDGFVLLRATKQNDYFIAVFRDGKGRLAFCKDAKDRQANRFPYSDIKIADETGKSVEDTFSKGFTPLVRTFRKKNPNGEVTTTGIADGTIIPLKQGKYKRIRITFSIGVETSDKIIFDEFVEFPSSP
jgi:hypothetical protein